MARIAFSVLRGLQVALAITSIGLSAYVVRWFMMASRTSSPAPFSFIIFTSVFSLLSVFFIEVVPRFAPRIAHPYACIALEMINTAFYFGGFIGLAVFIGGLKFCRGTVCSCGRADAVLAAAQFTVWIATAILIAKDMFMKGARASKNPDSEMRQA